MENMNSDKCTFMYMLAAFFFISSGLYKCLNKYWMYKKCVYTGGSLCSFSNSTLPFTSTTTGRLPHSVVQSTRRLKALRNLSLGNGFSEVM